MVQEILNKIQEIYKFCLKKQEELESKNEAATEFMEGLKEKEGILEENRELLATRKKEIEGVLAKTKETNAVALVQQKEVEEKNKAVGKLVGEAKVKEEKLASSEQSLIARETEVKKIEDVVRLSEETKELAKETAKEREKLDTKSKALGDAQTRVAGEQSDRAMKLAAGEKNVSERERSLTAGQGQLELLVAKEVRKILKK